MPLAPAAPPQAVPVNGGFDYVTVDEAHHRVYAAHTRAKRLLIVDSSSGKILGQVETGPMHGSAPAGDLLYTGNGTDDSVSQIDPVAFKVLASVKVGGPVDAIAYDPVRKRVYAAEDDGTHLFVIDAATMKSIATIPMPSEGMESVAVDPATGVVYQALPKGGGFAIIDPQSLAIRTVVKAPQLENPHPMAFSVASNQVIAGGTNGVLAAYTPDGTHVGDVAVQPRIDQCSTGSKGETIVCAGRGVVSVLAAKPGAAPVMLAKLDTGHRGIHTVGIDESNGSIWVVWGDANGSWIQQLRYTP